MSQSIVVLQSFPEPRPTTNPYVVMLRDALAVRPDVDVLTFSWRRALTARYDVLHLHWPETLVRARTRPRAAARQLLVALLVLRCAVRRVAVVRTRHNVTAHEPPGPAARFLLRLLDRSTVADVVLTPATPAVAGRLRAVVPHGDYRPWFAALPRSAPVRGRLAFVGILRPYKGVLHLLDTVAAIPDDEVGLVVAGRADDPDLAAAITARAAADPRVRVRLEHLPDDELVAEVTAAEVVVLPYREMHNSGSLLAALSLDRPVLVPDNEVTRSLAEEVGDEWVITYPGELTGEAVVKALGVARARPADSHPRLGDRAWDRAGEQHEDLYRSAVCRRRV